MPEKPEVALSTPIRSLPGVGPKRSAEFGKAGIHTLEDLLFHFPLRYEDRRQARRISTLRPGETVFVRGEIADAREIPTRRRNFSIFAVALRDDSGTLQVMWFNQKWLAEKLKNGMQVSLFGKVEMDRSGRRVQLPNPKWELDDASGSGIVPVYQRVRGVGGWVVRTIIEDLLKRYRLGTTESVPSTVREKFKLQSTSDALRTIHTPPADADYTALNEGRHAAHRSLVFEEFFMVQAGLALRKQHEDKRQGFGFETSPEIRKTLQGMLPFRLTEGQRKAFREIVEDMTSSRPMRRLLQGDVGCGKTIVGLLACALAIENGTQAAMMAPTEILAEQHFAAVSKHLSHTDYTPALLSGSLTAAERNRVKEGIAAGEIHLVVGTHALIQKDVAFRKLGLAIIDEQHRFGVLQRAQLLSSSEDDREPDLLIMTATPIPRSLTLTLFGDLSVSLIRDRPPGRKPVITAARTARSRPRINRFLEEEMAAGRQIYCVAPAIEDAEEHDLESAEAMFTRLKNTFENRRIGLLHSRLKRNDRETTMAAFAAGKLDMLASTTVIEVGVDVANATVMLVENAERFGLSQLHQLRGRVGRGEHKSYCILMYDPKRSEDARQRLEIMVQSDDGFKIAEKDLEIRGPGEFFGTRQSGVPSLRAGSLIRDLDVLQKARTAAFEFISGAAGTPGREQQEFRNMLARLWHRRYGLVLIG